MEKPLLQLPQVYYPHFILVSSPGMTQASPGCQAAPGPAQHSPGHCDHSSARVPGDSHSLENTHTVNHQGSGRDLWQPPPSPCLWQAKVSWFPDNRPGNVWLPQPPQPAQVKLVLREAAPLAGPHPRECGIMVPPPEAVHPEGSWELPWHQNPANLLCRQITAAAVTGDHHTL